MSNVRLLVDLEATGEGEAVTAASRLERELSIANQQAHDAIAECARLLAENERLQDELKATEKLAVYEHGRRGEALAEIERLRAELATREPNQYVMNRRAER